MVDLYGKKEECCGCTACKSICPKNAINMQLDEEGFSYPVINQDLCIECGACRKVCSFQNGYDKSQNFDLPEVYGVKHKDIETRMESRSGGMFTAISDYILDKSGVVYGAGYREHFSVCHKRATSRPQRNELRGSKYVQSELNDTYFLVKKDLLENKMVLFSGTPCQTSGLNSYLEKVGVNKAKLVLCDIVCHGTPSPRVWDDYISYMEKRYKGIFTAFEFRNKKLFGWRSHRETFVIEGEGHDSNIYTTLFLNNDMIRPSCYFCKYCNLQRPSDMTLGDFWGIENTSKEFDDGKGVSLVFINTTKGKDTFEKIKNEIVFIESNTKDCMQTNLKSPTKRPETRDQFWDDYRKLDFQNITKRYAGQSYKVKLKKSIADLLEKFGLLRLAKKALRRE